MNWETVIGIIAGIILAPWILIMLIVGIVMSIVIVITGLYAIYMGILLMVIWIKNKVRRLFK